MKPGTHVYVTCDGRPVGSGVVLRRATPTEDFEYVVAMENCNLKLWVLGSEMREMSDETRSGVATFPFLNPGKGRV